MATEIETKLDIPVATVYPSQREAARILRVSESTLSRAQVDSISVAGGGRHFAPRAILELAAQYRKRSLNEVAGDIIEYARQRAPEYVDTVREDCEEFFAARATPPINKERFLEEARRTLPRRLYEQIKQAYDQGAETTQIQLASHSDQAAHHMIR